MGTAPRRPTQQTYNRLLKVILRKGRRHNKTLTGRAKMIIKIPMVPDDQSGNIYRQITVPLKFLGKRECEKYKGQKNNLVERLIEDSEMV